MCKLILRVSRGRARGLENWNADNYPGGRVVCVWQMKYIDDDSTIFWAIGPNSGVLAMRAEHCGKEVTLTVPLENTAAGEVGSLLMTLALFFALLPGEA